MNYLYHLSPGANLISIKTHGLRINQKHRGVTLRSHNKEYWVIKYNCIPIFLIANPTIVTDLMLGLKDVEGSNWYVFKVNVRELPLIGGSYPGEFLCTTDIGVDRFECITLLKDFKLEQ